MRETQLTESPEDLLNIRQVAAILGPFGKPLSTVKVRQMVAQGILPATRATGHPNGNITIQRRYVLAHLEANTTQAVAA